MSRIYSGHSALERPVVSDLTFPEQLVVWAFRQWGEDPRNWCVVEQEFRLRCKRLNAMVALNGLSGLISVLSRRARRTLWFHRVWCPGVSADERTLLTLVARPVRRTTRRMSAPYCTGCCPTTQSKRGPSTPRDWRPGCERQTTFFPSVHLSANRPGGCGFMSRAPSIHRIRLPRLDGRAFHATWRRVRRTSAPTSA